MTAASGGHRKKITFIAPPTENPGACLALGIRICYLWQTLGIFNKSKIVPAEKLKLELVEIAFIEKASIFISGLKYS